VGLRRVFRGSGQGECWVNHIRQSRVGFVVVFLYDWDGWSGSIIYHPLSITRHPSSIIITRHSSSTSHPRDSIVTPPPPATALTALTIQNRLVRVRIPIERQVLARAGVTEERRERALRGGHGGWVRR
jgi:hypothetical protein